MSQEKSTAIIEPTLSDKEAKVGELDGSEATQAAKVSDIEKGSDESDSNELHLVTSEDSLKFEKSRGVRRIENVKLMIDHAPNGKSTFLILTCCLYAIAWCYSFDGSTTYNYSTPATSSFNHHSMITTVSIATSIIGSVMKPFLAKLSDITSRPICYAVSLLLYTIGTIVAASSGNIVAYVVGEVFTTVGSNGIRFMNQLIVADMTPLKWRGFFQGIMSTPYIYNVWFSGLIVEAILAKNWRWGYGMFAIIMPATVIPAVSVLYYYERKAQKLVPKVQKPKKSIGKILWDAAIEIDAFGLIVMGFGWSLLLLPFSLYSYANGGWHNASMIAMVVVGGLLLIFFAVYEIKWAPFPSMPKRIIFNKTFVTAALIDFIYQLDGGIRTYFSTIVWVTKPWSNRDWTYFNNTLTVGLCFFGVIAGIICRITHRYKYMQIFGIAVRILGYGLVVRPQGTVPNTASLVMGQICISFGGAFSVIGTQVASEASVPHQDLGLVMSTLSLWSNIGAAVGAAISSPIWTSKLPKYLNEFLPSTVNATEAFNLYSNVSALKAYPFDSEIRQAGVKAYSYIAVFFFAPPVVLETVAWGLSWFQTNFYLGDTQNAIEEFDGKKPGENPELEKKKEEPKTFMEKLRVLLA